MVNFDKAKVEKIKLNRPTIIAEFKIRFKKAIFSSSTEEKRDSLYTELCKEAQRDKLTMPVKL